MNFRKYMFSFELTSKYMLTAELDQRICLTPKRVFFTKFVLENVYCKICISIYFYRTCVATGTAEEYVYYRTLESTCLPPTDVA